MYAQEPIGSNAKVSIIVPVYKVERYLHRTVESLLDQTYKNLEVLLVDDGSPDKSGKICDQFAEKDSRVRVIHQENQGVSAARNAGLDAMTGEWVCFCDGDDWYETDYIEKMIQCARREHADYIICDYKVVSPRHMDIISKSLQGLSTGCDSRLVIAIGPISSCCHMILRELFEQSKVRFPKNCRQYEELSVMPILARHASRIGVINEPLYNYFQRGDHTSASNHMACDFSSFYVSWNIMKETLGAEYYWETQYHAIYALLYGGLLELCKAGRSRGEMKDLIHSFEKDFPDYWKNPYLKYIGKAQIIYLFIAHLNCISGLKVLS